MAIINHVRWEPDGSDGTVFAYKFPESNLSTYTILNVGESQEAILFSKGQLMSKFGPGQHTLNTENLPILRSLYGLPFGKKNPFTAEIFFVNKLQPCNIDWNIDKMEIHDVDYNVGIPLVANGRYGLKIMSSEDFLIKLVGSKSQFTERDLTDMFYGEASTKTKSTLMQFMMNNKIGLKKISAHLDLISTHLKEIMQVYWENIGFELTNFYITSIAVDETSSNGRMIQEAITRQSAQTIGGYSWQQSQVMDVAKGAVSGISNGSGGSGLLGAIIATNMMGGLGGGGSAMQPHYNQPAFNNSSENGAQLPTTNTVKKAHKVFCSNCSKKFDNNLNFCPNCGDKYNPCPHCGTDNNESAKRCVSCGLTLASLDNICSQCNCSIAANEKFCANCGAMQGGEEVCSRCNFSIQPNVKFCPNCGKPQL